MARIYAGILGPIGFLTALLRGVVVGSRVESVVLAAIVGLWVFAAIGYVLGQIAQQTIETSVRDRIDRELASREEEESDGPRTTATRSAASRPAAAAPAA